MDGNVGTVEFLLFIKTQAQRHLKSTINHYASCEGHDNPEQGAA